MSAKRKRYDYVHEIDKWVTRLRPTRRILRKLVREAVDRALEESKSHQADRIAKELVP